MFASSGQRSGMQLRCPSGQGSFPQQRITCCKTPMVPKLRHSVPEHACSTGVTLQPTGWKFVFREWKKILVYSCVDRRYTLDTGISQHKVFWNKKPQRLLGEMIMKTRLENTSAEQGLADLSFLEPKRRSVLCASVILVATTHWALQCRGTVGRWLPFTPG